MNAEDELLAQEEKPKKREKQEDTRQERGRKMTKTKDRQEDRRSKAPTGRFTNFTSLTAPIDQVLMQIKDDPTLKWLEKLKADHSKWTKGKRCFQIGRASCRERVCQYV